MSMARLIKKIALSTNNPNNHEHFQSYTSTDDPNTNSSRGGKLSTWIERRKRKIFSSEPSRQSQFTMDQGTIKKTAEFTVTSSPKGAIELSSHLRGDDKTSQVHIVAQERSLSGSPPDRTGSRLATRQDGDQHVKDYTSDEEVLIKPPQARARVRTSQDSFATQSMASEKVYRS